MTKQELLEELQRCADLAHGDRETAHCAADKALIDFINDEEIKEAYHSFHKWYA